MRRSFLFVGSNQGRDYGRRKTIQWKKEKEKKGEKKKGNEKKKGKEKRKKRKKRRKTIREEENRAWRERKKKSLILGVSTVGSC